MSKLCASRQCLLKGYYVGGVEYRGPSYQVLLLYVMLNIILITINLILTCKFLVMLLIDSRISMSVAYCMVEWEFNTKCHAKTCVHVPHS